MSVALADPGKTCRGCGSPLGGTLFSAAASPCHSVRLIADAAEARAFPVGEVRLAACTHCGLVQNAAFVADRVGYDPRYEATQLHSAHFRTFAEDLAERLGEAHDLDDRQVVEIGCGQGDFLAILAARTGCRALGIDPAVRSPGRRPGGIELIRGQFEEHARTLAGADLVLCRHTLEHIEYPVAFLRRIRDVLGPDGAPLFLDVPEASRIFGEGAFWDVYYEHCNYFDADSLARVAAAAGFQVATMATTFHGQSLEMTARPAAGSDEPTERLDPDDGAAWAFARRADGILRAWRDRLRGPEGRAPKTVLWGAGSKAVAFLAGIGVAPAVAAAVDINPRKRGHFLPGSGVPVIAPEELPPLAPEAVVVMNPAYRGEIALELARLRLAPTLWNVDDVA